MAKAGYHDFKNKYFTQYYYSVFFSFCSKNVFHILNLFVCADENVGLNNMKISLDVQPKYLKQLSFVM